MLWLYIQAPFAACRPFVAGWYRPTAGFVTHSAVYGLLLNLAGKETRLWEHEKKHDGRTPATLTQPTLPHFDLALGVSDSADPPRVQTIYQQLHNYLVGGNDKVPDPDNPASMIGKNERGFRRGKGNKFNIQPVRREVLCDVRVVAMVKGAPEDLMAAIRKGLRGELNSCRYGLPFLGDNNLLLDQIEETNPRPARWYTLVTQPAGRPRASTTRLTAYVNRADMSGTRSALFAPEDELIVEPPETALVPVGSQKEFDKWLKKHSMR